MNKQDAQAKNQVWEWAKAILFAAVIFFVLRSFIASPSIVDGYSMEPRLYTGERVMVNKLLYQFTEPKRGEIIIFQSKRGPDYIKRVIALPGEKVRVEGDQVYINGKLFDEPYLKEAIEQANKAGTPYNFIDFAEQTVPENTLFVMGDNRSKSEDSRDPSVGFVSYDEIVGRAELVFWPLQDIELIK
ncbi:signal peptidase I [Paenibacillus sp. SC116]|uniref:signal peptidase I n=1 Tax=Paenibacillus sp. SC116 TaxID=2968986 RepID=UPI00215B03BD|nr:signal peptidase I [Paenibacillus sp. SC116]MCR8845947.1 signal peptidase I [Paenibacillus sp. SC116]